MNYPIWDIAGVGQSLLIAVMAIVHVYIAHFAVGGGLFLVITERKGLREKSPAILEYTRNHSLFFLLLTLVLGALTGVGIWFVIGLISPAATSLLIHNFVFGWAIEWVFFVGEIVALFVYYYTFGKMGDKKHQIVGWLYFIYAWLSLFVISGIVTFMLSPGKWLETKNFWDGFFNPTFVPSVFFRTFLALSTAGLFGFMTSSFLRDPDFRNKMMRYCAKWLILPLVLLLVSSAWYMDALPDHPHRMIGGGSHDIQPFVKGFLYISPILLLGGLLLAVRMPGFLRRAVAVGMIVLGFLYTGSFEWIREGARRPFVVSEHLYSNSIPLELREKINTDGILAHARWVDIREITDENRMKAGRHLFNLQCASCHAIGGPINDITPLTAKFNVFGMDSMLDGLGKINRYMPPFHGTVTERAALAHYIVHGIHGKSESAVDPVKIQPLESAVPPFDEADDEYMVLAWNDLGMHCITDFDRVFGILPPANTLFAQVIKRGEVPELISEGITVTYTVPDGFAHPEKHVDFWEHSRELYGKDLEPGVGLSGNRVDGEFSYVHKHRAFVVDKIPVVPYTDEGAFLPYPLFTVEVKDLKTGDILTSTKVTAPTSTEMGCKNCHGGEYRVNGVAGIDEATALDILRVHDRISRTKLMERVRGGRPVSCRECHADPAAGSEGKPGIMNLSASVHGFHANHLSGRDGSICKKCHPADAAGVTKCLRGIHAMLGLECGSCHGMLEDHALALLKGEMEKGVPSAERIMAELKTRTAASVEEINPRQPWTQQPDCLNCHVNFNPPETFESFNQWTSNGDALYRNRSDAAGVMCAACHGSPHAVYPAVNPFGNNRDNIQPMQYQGNPYPIGANRNCKVCHRMEMPYEFHHPNSLADFRNAMY